MIDDINTKGKYWDQPWSLVDGCTPCSPGCDHCWSERIARRFDGKHVLTNEDTGKYCGHVILRPEWLDVPLRIRKPTVFAVWNDLFHEAVTSQFINDAWNAMFNSPRHTFLVLTKRPAIMEKWIRMAAIVRHWPLDEICPDNIYLGLTVCNQQEADEKIPVFLQVPGRKFLSIEPMLGPINLMNLPLGKLSPMGFMFVNALRGWKSQRSGGCGPGRRGEKINAVLLGGETGPGARPMHPDWARKVRDDCKAAGVPFFLKNLGMWSPSDEPQDVFNKSTGDFETIPAENAFIKKKAGRVLDGRTHDDLPWIKKDDA